MFRRKSFKKKARGSLKQNYWRAVIVAFLALLLINEGYQFVSFNIGDDSARAINNQITNLHKNKSYDSNTSISIKITNKDTTMLDGIITLEQKVSNDTKITEDISTSTLASTLEKSIDNLIEEKIQTLQTTLLGDETAWIT